MGAQLMGARRRWLGGVCLGLVAVGAASCSWSRFTDLSEDAPIMLLQKSDAVRAGFGSSLTFIRLDELTRLMVGGSPAAQGAAVYNPGLGDTPTVDAIDAGHCERGDDLCYLGKSTAGLARAARQGSDDDLLLCFVSGVGRTEHSGTGLLVRCDDDFEYTYDVPDNYILEAIDWALNNSEPMGITLTSDRDEAPAMAAGIAEESAAWYYGPLSWRPQEMIAPVVPADESFGETLAILRTEDDRRVAVGAPKANRVWLFRSDEVDAPRAVGCLGGPAGFGRTLASGRVDTDDIDDLVVADDGNVTVFSGARLAELDAGTSDCSLTSLPADSILASFTCGQTPDIDGCAGSRFGSALAVGDLDGDGDGEVIVGAPYMDVRGDNRAGAVLIYDADPDAPFRLTEVKFLSSAEGGDLLGTSLATTEMENGRHVIAAGAPGHGKVALFYCTSLLQGDAAGRRCE